MHVLGNSGSLILRVVVILLLNPGINRIRRFPVFTDVHALEFCLWLDTEQSEVVQGEEHDEAAGGGPQHDADTSGDVDAKEVPRLRGMPLKCMI